MGERDNALAFCVACWYAFCAERGYDYGDPWANLPIGRGTGYHGESIVNRSRWAAPHWRINHE